MENIIKPLPEAVRSAVRSGLIIGGLTTVVEELLYNSLDAGATKVSVYVDVNNGYAKVEDDGSGICRDGLVLLGERYATSKLNHSPDKDDGTGSFGFRGEVLCSIADISLIEIVTKVHGRPNGYRKVMKGRRCLYLSIDNDRQHVGTTVIVRDLFYNHPVRRRQMQSSAKKVLHSVKKCAVRIALVQPKVSFRVVDMESEDELLHTHASSSPLSVFCSNFGVEPSSLQELSYSKGSLKLTGFLSGPSTLILPKAIQYIYVNSRFIVKGPIHKVLNRLAETCWDQLSGDKSAKRGQPTTGPTYCLNLTCPRSSYDLNLEFSRTSVEFKDWAPVLAFMENSAASFWSKTTTKGESYNCEADQIGNSGQEKVVGIGNMASMQKGGKEHLCCDDCDQLFPDADWLLRTCEISTKRRRTGITKHEQESALSSLCSMEMQVEDDRDLPLQQGIDRKHKNSRGKAVRVFRNQMNSFDSGNASPSNCNFDVKGNVDNRLWETNKDLMSFNDDLFKDDITTRKRDRNDAEDYFSCSKWMDEDELRVDDYITSSTEVQTGWTFELRKGNSRNKDSNDHEKLSPRNRSWETIVQTPFDYGKSTRLGIDNCYAKRSFSNSTVSGEADGLTQSDIFLRAQCQDGQASGWQLHLPNNVGKDLEVSPMKCCDSLSFHKGFIDVEHTPQSLSKQSCSTSCFSVDIDQHSAVSFPSLSVEAWDIEHVIPDGGLERRSKATVFDGFEQSNEDKEELYFDDFGDKRSYENFYSTSCLDSASHFWNDSAGFEKSICDSTYHGHIVDTIHPLRYGDFFSEETFSPCLGKIGRHYTYSSSVCWSPSISIDREVKMDVQRCQAPEVDHIPGERLDRNNLQCSPDALLSGVCGDMLGDGTFSPCLDFQNKVNTHEPSVRCVSAISVHESPKTDLRRCQVSEPNCSYSEQSGRNCKRPRRSSSAPPIYRGKRKFLSVTNCFLSTAQSPAQQTAHQICSVTEREELQHPHNLPEFSSEQRRLHETSCAEDSLLCVDRSVKGTSNITQFSTRSEDDMTKTACCSPGYLKQVQDSECLRIKWREGCPDTGLESIVNQRVRNRLNHAEDESGILDIHSCMLNFAGDSLVPKSINRSCLESAKVLLQVDNKFIPVVASGTLAVIDQHAADERIRLEDMRQKVISGELKSITYLEEEKDLVLPEMAYQLLCNYAEHIQQWGWMCNIFSQDSGSFTKNLNLLNVQPTRLTLLAVPCILGVNLSDADLLEFLEQLAETDGSSTIPPSILRVLNNKACRGAIMFGDKLLPSECSLIVDELKRTSLCFQCAHGRPTTVPLVNLGTLRKGIAQLQSWHEGSNDSWHGLCRKEINFGRAKRRLEMAGVCE